MILGRFYFKLTNNGNLLGEFFNQISIRNTVEAANRIKPLELLTFTGEYTTTWIEGADANICHIDIRLINGTNNTIFELTWTFQNATTPTFYGEGFLVDGILIGNYWDREIHQLDIPNSSHLRKKVNEN